MQLNCIQYEEYKKILADNASTPRKNIFEENRTLLQQVDRLNSQNIAMNSKYKHLQNVCNSIVEAIGKVYSEQLAQELMAIIDCAQQEQQYLHGQKSEKEEAGEASDDRIQETSRTIYNMLITYQQLNTVSDYAKSDQSKLQTPGKVQNFDSLQIRSKSSSMADSGSVYWVSCLSQPQKSPISSIKKNCRFIEDPSTNRSSNTPSILKVAAVATSINCELCQQTFAPNQFIIHASRCRSGVEDSNIFANSSITGQQESQEGISFGSDDLQSAGLDDTQDRRLKKQSNDYLLMMESLVKMQSEIEEQIKMIKFSKEKIDRDTQKRKLQKDLAKVMCVIEQKKKQGKTKNKAKQNIKAQDQDKSMKIFKKGSFKSKQ